MSDVDLTRVPTGEIGWTALMGHALETDDRIERYFLELKSDVDLNTRKGRAKVAKFILGAANRDPQKATRRFGGHAVMLLGVGGGVAAGIPGFEAMDLARDVQRFIGVDGPEWDFDRIPANGGQDVIAIVAAPPTGDVWTCRADGEGLNDGDIYVRADGETRKATGDEVRAMLARSMIRTKPSIDVGVEVTGEVAAIRIDTDALVGAIEQEGKALLAQIAPRRVREPSGAIFAGIGRDSFSYENRSKNEFRTEVETWLQQARANPAAGVLQSMGRARQGIRIRVTNRTRTFLRDVRIDVEFDGDVIATPWQEPETQTPIDIFPGIPVAWGASTIASMFIPRLAPIYSGSQHGVLRIRQAAPGAKLTLFMDSLRPEEDFTTGDDDVVLVLLASEAPPGPILASWRLTADGVHDVHEGELAVMSTFTDLRGTIEEILSVRGS